MMNLWRAEWLKTRKRPANIGILAVAAVIVVAGILIWCIVALVEGKESTTYASALAALPFPSGLIFPVQILSVIGSLLAIVFVANSVGSEYSRDTWKMILPRQGSRLSFLWTKLLMAVVCMVALIIVTIVMGQIAAWLGLLLLGGDLVRSGGTMLAEQLQAVTYTLMQMILYGVMTLLAAVVTRSTIGGIVAGFVLAQVLGIIAFLSKVAALLLPTSHLQNLYASWVIKEPAMIEQTTAMFGRTIAPALSLAVVLGYIAVFLGLSLWLFQKRDMAGN